MADLRNLLASGDPNFTDDAGLAASELPTNGMIRTNDACILIVWSQPGPPAVRVEVEDCSHDSGRRP